jgi:hypothetical protein
MKLRLAGVACQNGVVDTLEVFIFQHTNFLFPYFTILKPGYCKILL